MRILYLTMFLLVVLNTSSFGTECEISKVYRKVEVDRDTKAMDSYGELKEVKCLLVPTKIDTGNYQVDVTRKSQNLYEIIYKDLYIETKYCYEYATGETVILKIDSYYGYSIGKIIFK